MITLFISACQKEETTKRVSVHFDAPQYVWGQYSHEVLQIWGIVPDLDRSYIKKACERYENLTSNTLVITMIEKEEIQERMQAALRGETDMPDILVSYGGTNIDAFHPIENFYDFSDAQWVNDLSETSINQTVYQGKIIGLPFWEASISGTLYNKSIFERYDIRIPTTQDEFMQACEKLLANGITPMYMPMKEPSMMLYQFPLDTVVKDTATLQALNAGDIGYQDIPEMRDIVEWYKTMAENGYFGKQYLDNTWDGMSPALESEAYAMMLCWDTWLYTDFQGDASKFGLFPAFVGVPEQGTFEGPNLNLFMVNKKSEKMEVALDFINFLADPYNYNVAFEDILTAPVFKNQVNSMSTPQYLENERLIEKLYHDSIAWLRIKSFSQMDAKCIYDYIAPSSTMTLKDTLQAMDVLREERQQAFE